MTQPPTSAAPSTGYFVLSLDTELSWGYFDRDHQRPRLFSPDGSRERRAIRWVLDLCDELAITATWALVGHLFFPRCEDCAPCPIAHWRGRFASFAEIHGGADPRWYAPEALGALMQGAARHEIAFHGFSHEPFDALDPDQARAEIANWLRLGERHGIAPVSVVFPRNRVAHLGLFAEHGFLSYRGDPPVPTRPRRGSWAKVRKHLAHLSGTAEIPLYDPAGLCRERPGAMPGLVDVPASEHLFGFNRRLELVLDGLGLHRLRLAAIRRAVRRAAAEGLLLHLWCHPWELRTPQDRDKLRAVLEWVCEARAQGRMESLGMAQMAMVARGDHQGRCAASPMTEAPSAVRAAREPTRGAGAPAAVPLG